MARSAKKDPPHTEREVAGMPTAYGLATDNSGRARVRNDGKIHVTDAGHRDLGRELRARGAHAREAGIRAGVNGARYDRDGNLIEHPWS